MARIPDGELERIKGEVSFAHLIEGQGIALGLAGQGPGLPLPVA